MSESSSLFKLQRLWLIIPDSDMAAAAQQLMQLSDEDNNSSSSNDGRKKTLKANKEKRLLKRSRDEITSAKIEEIFGKEEEEVSRPTKKRRYRFLESIYKETKPIKVSYGKNLWY